METLAHALVNLGSPTVALVGDVMLDRYTFGEVGRISPEAPVPVLRVAREEERLGGAGSVAADLLLLGARVRLVGIVGEDADGDVVMRLASDEKADASGLVRTQARRTTVKNRHVARGGPYGQQVLRVDREDDRACPADLEARVRDAALRAVDGADVVLLSDYAKGVLSPGVVRAVIDEARRRKVPVLVDPKGADFTRYAGATALTPNRRETAEATGITPSDPDSIRRAGHKLLQLAGLDAAIITLDRDGMALFHRDGGELFAATAARDVFDVTGAGDMVVAMLALCLGGGLSWDVAVHLANAAAGVEVGKLGSVPVTRQEVAMALGASAGPAGKVMERAQAAVVLRARRAAGARVVFTNGCFDVLHAGHSRYLARARDLGELLVVGLNDDDSVRRLKGPERPIMPLQDRAELLASLACVDLVVPFGEDTPGALIEAVAPDILVKGEDWKDKGVVGREFVEARGGKVVLMPMEPGRSTTGVVERIRKGG
ncbi:MAG: D-glycero-beta-D-manno-heptose 1-phosphate adenylyltransferase [Deltaproteobacteria bacterium]|nr:D-glycero-beta-D-manno-heptose 1-phosphate adenylyltransferase [Deltaproteobacteria bacterium]